MNIVSHEKTILDDGKERYRVVVNNNGSLHDVHVAADATTERAAIANIWRYLIKNSKKMIRLQNRTKFIQSTEF